MLLLGSETLEGYMSLELFTNALPLTAPTYRTEITGNRRPNPGAAAAYVAFSCRFPRSPLYSRR